MLRLVVVLERRALVHDLKTLELLRTLETDANPKVGSNLPYRPLEHNISAF